MDSTSPIYDSLTSGAIRMARRHWYVIVIVAAIGLAFGLYRSSGTSSYTAESTVDIMLSAVNPNTKLADPSQPNIDTIALARRVKSTADAMTLPPSTQVAVTGDQTAGSLTITVTSGSEKDATDALDLVVESGISTAVDAATGATNVRINALEQLSKESHARVEQFDSQLASLESEGVSPAASNPVVLARMDAADTAASVDLELALAKSRLESLSTELAVAGIPTIEPADSSILMLPALTILGAILAFGVLFLIQATDGRLRRRLQIERDAPSASVLGVVSRNPADSQLSVLGRTLSHFATENEVSRINVIALRGIVPDQLAAALRSSQPIPVEATDATTASGDFGDQSVGLVIVVPFGSIHHEALQAAVADAVTAGSTKIAVIMTEVPAADHAWAAVSMNA